MNGLQATLNVVITNLLGAIAASADDMAYGQEMDGASPIDWTKVDVLTWTGSVGWPELPDWHGPTLVPYVAGQILLFTAKQWNQSQRIAARRRKYADGIPGSPPYVLHGVGAMVQCLDDMRDDGMRTTFHATYADASRWADWGHCCTTNHRVTVIPEGRV